MKPISFIKFSVALLLTSTVSSAYADSSGMSAAEMRARLQNLHDMNEREKNVTLTETSPERADSSMRIIMIPPTGITGVDQNNQATRPEPVSVRPTETTIASTQNANILNNTYQQHIAISPSNSTLQETSQSEQHIAISSPNSTQEQTSQSEQYIHSSASAILEHETVHTSNPFPTQSQPSQQQDIHDSTPAITQPLAGMTSGTTHTLTGQDPYRRTPAVNDYSFIDIGTARPYPDIQITQPAPTPQRTIVTAAESKLQEPIYLPIKFDFNSYAVRPDQIEPVMRYCTAMRGVTGPRGYLFTGHTDSVGTDAYNLRLSKQRAQSIVNFLRTNCLGIETLSLQATGQGKRSPLPGYAANSAEQRRVEIIPLR